MNAIAMFEGRLPVGMVHRLVGHGHQLISCTAPGAEQRLSVDQNAMEIHRILQGMI